MPSTDKTDDQAASRDMRLSASSPLPSKCFFPRIMHRRRLSILNSPNTLTSLISHFHFHHSPPPLQPTNTIQPTSSSSLLLLPFLAIHHAHSACSQRDTFIIRCTCAPATQTLVLSCLFLAGCFCGVSLRPATPASPKELHPSSQLSTTNDLLTRGGRMWPKGRLHSSIAWPMSALSVSSPPLRLAAADFRSHLSDLTHPPVCRNPFGR